MVVRKKNSSTGELKYEDTKIKKKQNIMCLQNVLKVAENNKSIYNNVKCNTKANQSISGGFDERRISSKMLLFPVSPWPWLVAPVKVPSYGQLVKHQTEVKIL